ncbi:carboxypeptidase-like regulatory domain-containing protein [Stigmatella sp. ncwal1]|uniref:Carboxypeptidase-like regulatory domain-containing protein n=1 Tax=Stigmatella ashevillensis TaxID=2995309 RepID=A0ABT5DME9_9BACT|nr:carboxypeptidase-like regulatory domain-containing protein [Stigmatella ashevillena]MDC0714313.1 carboxypeptidase-like regulatory domain-containing protein [Stigmatella ashevillena]
MAPSCRCPSLLALVVLALLGLPRDGLTQGVEAEGWERASLRLRYGVAHRDGQQAAPSPGFRYSGMTPNDMAAWATVYGWAWLGGWAGVQREGFSLLRESARVSEGSLWRASGGVVTRLGLGPVRAELSAGYGFAQLPLFSGAIPGAPAFQYGSRHAVLVGGRLRFPLLFRLQAELRGEYPLVLSAKDGEGAEAGSRGFEVGAALRVPLVRARRWSGALALDYQYVQDRLSASRARSEQTLQRLGAALEFSWFDAEASAAGAPVPPPPSWGELALKVVDAQTGEPLAGPQVTLVVAGEAREPQMADPEGQMLERALEPGEVVARVQAEGYQLAEGHVTVGAGERATLEIRASRLAPQVGRLQISVTDKRDGTPVPGAVLLVGERELRGGASGQVRLEDVTPGPVSVRVSAPGFQPMEEAALIVAGQEAVLPIQLVPTRRVGYATIAGRVRSTGGRSLVAWLVIPTTKVRSRTNAQGSFSLKVRPGTYRIIISAKGHLKQTKSVTVRDGEQAIFNVDLFPKSRTR